jgi:hypothetical protein
MPKVAVCVIGPLVPPIDRAKLPIGVVLEVVIVSVELPVPGIEEGEKVAATPVGRPDTESAMASLKPKPPAPLVDTVYVVLPPALTACEVGVAVI